MGFGKHLGFGDTVPMAQGRFQSMAIPNFLDLLFFSLIDIADDKILALDLQKWIFLVEFDFFN